MDRYLTTEEAKEIILCKDCSPETKASDVVFTSLEMHLCDAQDKKTVRWVIARIDAIIQQSIKECEELRADNIGFFFVNQIVALKKDLGITDASS